MINLSINSLHAHEEIPILYFFWCKYLSISSAYGISSISPFSRRVIMMISFCDTKFFISSIVNVLCSIVSNSVIRSWGVLHAYFIQIFCGVISIHFLFKKSDSIFWWIFWVSLSVPSKSNTICFPIYSNFLLKLMYVVYRIQMFLQLFSIEKSS